MVLRGVCFSVVALRPRRLVEISSHGRPHPRGYLTVAVAKISVADPGSGAFLTIPRSGMGKTSGSGSGMNNPDHISKSL
jgi:hypothetical protein